MAASLHLYAYVDGDLTEEDFKQLFCNVFGSKYFNLSRCPSAMKQMEFMEKLLAKLPAIWVGEVSWLKNLFFGDYQFVPNICLEIYNLVQEDRPVVNEELIAKVRKIFESNPVAAAYSTADCKDIVDFLEENLGRRLFTFSL